MDMLKEDYSSDQVLAVLRTSPDSDLARRHVDVDLYALALDIYSWLTSKVRSRGALVQNQSVTRLRHPPVLSPRST